MHTILLKIALMPACNGWPIPYGFFNRVFLPGQPHIFRPVGSPIPADAASIMNAILPVLTTAPAECDVPVIAAFTTAVPVLIAAAVVMMQVAVSWADCTTTLVVTSAGGLMNA